MGNSLLAVRDINHKYIVVGGEMKLPPYTPEEARNRETQINAWLASMEW